MIIIGDVVLDKLLIDYELDISSEQYVKLLSTNRFSLLRILIGLIIGIAFVFYSYTMLTGIIIILISLIALIAPRLLPGTFEKRYDDLKYLHQPIIYKIYLDKIIITGKNFIVETSWEYLSSWKKMSDWYVFYFVGFPEIYIPDQLISNLKEKELLFEILKK